ncbi:LysR substrate-binding domain-containing protein, partial [Escherichia coli]|nr:LysR substrate-binding domain-containing protein [Escherichia coli]
PNGSSGAVESSSLPLNLSLLIRGEFVSILPLSIARHHVSRGRMRVLPLAPLEPLGEVVLVWRADTSAPVADLFSECLRESSSELLDGEAE